MSETTPRLSPAWYVEENKRLAAEIASLRAQLDEAKARIDELETGFSIGLAEIKYELNGLATMGAVPMWGSLIGRLDDLAQDVLNAGKAQ